MKVAVMQPYFFPYIGYFQLIAAADLFVLYDDIKYTKKGWINRNQMLRNGAATLFSLPLKHDSDSLHVRDRQLASDFDRGKLLNRFKGAYESAPYFPNTWPVVEQIVRNGETNLFRYVHHSIAEICRHLGVATPIRVSSTIDIDDRATGQERVLALCEAVGATIYVNAVGGMALYSQEAFQRRGIALKFIHSKPFEYRQFGGEFVPSLSIVDVMMFNTLQSTADAVTGNFELIPQRSP